MKQDEAFFVGFMVAVTCCTATVSSNISDQFAAAPGAVQLSLPTASAMASLGKAENIAAAGFPPLQFPIAVCPESLNKNNPPKKCRDCGGDNREQGICDNILRSGDQQRCGETGCGVYCKCTPDGWVTGPSDPNHQIPIQVCPEEIKQPKKECSACGGEDPDAPGMCKDVLRSGDQTYCPPQGCGYVCFCNNGKNGECVPVPSPTSTEVVTDVVDGKTETATFGVATLPAWKDLRSHTEITSTMTGSDCKATKAPFYLFFGGIVWYPLAGAGSPPDDKRKNDDKKCEPKPKCNDCGGANTLGLCQSGDKQNCPCDDKECPKEPPQCDATNCEGNDSLECQAEELKDCKCCPKEMDCDAEECNGKDGKCENEKSKGCSCEDSDAAPYPDGYPQSTYSQQEANDDAEEVFKDVYNSDEKRLSGWDGKKSPTKGEIKCDVGEPLTAFNMEPSFAVGIASKYCTLNMDNSREDTMGGDHLDPKKDLDTWLHFSFTKADGQCSQTCEDTFKTIILRCQHDGHSFIGTASSEDKCGTYSVIVQGNPRPDTTPPKYTTGTCSATIKQYKGGWNGLEVKYLKDGAGQPIEYDKKGIEDAFGEENKSETSSDLPEKLVGWRHNDNDGMEFAYGDQKWNTDKEWEKEENETPRIKWLGDWLTVRKVIYQREVAISWKC